MSMRFPVTFEKISERQLNSDKIKDSLQYIADSAERNQTYNFQSEPIRRSDVDVQREADGNGGNLYRYTATITVYKESYRSAGAVREQFDKIKLVMAQAANKMRWTILGEGSSTIKKEEPTIIKEEEVSKVINKTLELPPLTQEVYQKHFGRLFNREPQIRLIYDAIKQAVQTNFRERNHILLRGLAGCGKTEVLGGKNVVGGFYEWLGKDNIWEVDSTTLTKAGLERELLSRSREGTLPPIIKLEEVEKVVEPRTVNCLLQVMDVRGRIQRTNARDGDEFADCKVLVLGTCNDSNLLRTFADGAIWSRFSVRPICKRPDQGTMHKILTRVCTEVQENGGWCGDQRHVDRVVNFMWNTLKGLKEYKKDYNDPRLGRALLSGGDRILDDSSDGYFADFIKVCDGDEMGEGG